MDIATKLEILADAAKYDVACTSSGVNRSAKKGELGNTIDAGICHSFTADGRCITLLKVLMTNACIYNCAYCVNRAENEVRRAVFKPRELADLTIGFYRRNYIEGLFLSSGVIKSPDYTTELMICTLSILRNEYKFRGYIHAKAVPGGATGAFSRPYECEYGTAFAPKLGTVSARQIEAEYYCTHAADKELYRRRPRHPRPYAPQHHLLLAGAHCTQNTRVCPCWAINANDNRRHTRIGLPNTRPFQRPVPHAFVEARVLQRILTRER